MSARTTLQPLDTLLDLTQGRPIALPDRLAALYGSLRFPPKAGRPWVIGNFVASIDGVTALGVPGLSDGGTISGHNAHDRMLMGLLRAVSGAVIVGAGTLRADFKHVWTAEHVYPDLAAEFAALRRELALPPHPLSVFVTARGDVDLGLRVFRSGLPALVATTGEGAQRLRRQVVPPTVEIEPVGDGRRVTAASIVDMIARRGYGPILLLEGGPHLMADFFGEARLDELFLTIAPQIAGRDETISRPGLVQGRLFCPGQPLWGKLASVKRAGDHLFLRYVFA